MKDWKAKLEMVYFSALINQIITVCVGHITEVLPLSRSILSLVAALKCSEVVNIVESFAEF